MKVAYKVVIADTRKSIISRLNNPELEKFVLTYNAGDTVHAPKSTPGILMFQDEYYANVLKKNISRNCDEHSFTVIEVLPLSKPKRVYCLISDGSSGAHLVRNLSTWRRWQQIIDGMSSWRMWPPYGTIAARSVRVLT